MHEYKESTVKLFLDRIAPMVVMNLLFFVLCLPLVTIGPAWCGLYSGIRYAVRGDKWLPGFWEGFRNRFFSTALISTLCHIFVIYLLYNTISIGYYQIEGFLIPLIFSIFVVALALMLTGCMYVLQVYHPTSPRQWMKDAVDLVIEMPWQSLLIGILMFLPAVLLTCFALSISLLILAMVTCYYSLVALIATILFRKTLRELYEETDEGVVQ